MRHSVLLCMLAAVVASVLGVALESPLPGYGVEEFSWEIESVPGGATVAVTGTIQEVYSQLKQINPTFETDFPPVEDNNTEVLAALQKRDTVNCGVFSDTGSVVAIKSGISHLRGVSGQPTNGPGPGNCGRVSCSYDSAIWWCNDNKVSKTLPSFNNIADSAQLIINRCVGILDVWVSGQDFHSDNWNGIVRGTKC